MRKLDKKDRILEIAKHNLYVSFTEIRKIRNAIANGKLWELVERRANSNPYLLEALKELRTKENKEFLEQFEPTSSNKALFYTGEQTIHRPIVHRCHKRLFNRYTPVFNTTIVFPDGGKPYSTYYTWRWFDARRTRPRQAAHSESEAFSVAAYDGCCIMTYKSAMCIKRCTGLRADKGEEHGEQTQHLVYCDRPRVRPPGVASGRYPAQSGSLAFSGGDL